MNIPIEIRNLTFQYGGPNSSVVLKEVNMVIPAGKTTAIVGTSGSGKTTLIKLILGFYTPTQGNIYIDGVPIACYNLRQWRLSCGVGKGDFEPVEE